MSSISGSGLGGARRAIRRATPKLAGLTAASLIAGAGVAGITTTANGAVAGGRSIEVFHGRDFVGLSGYPARTPVTVDVVRGGAVVGTVTRNTLADGSLEINHLGDTDCWAPPVTPDIMPGDQVRSTFTNATGATVEDFTAVRDVYVDTENIVFDAAGGTITVQGHARSSAAAPIEAGHILEARLRWGTRLVRDPRADVGGALRADGSFEHTFTGFTSAQVQDAIDNGLDVALE